MPDLTINKVIENIIDDKIRQIPYPTKCKITKTYNGGYVDVETNTGELTYIEAIGNNIAVGNTGVILYLNGGFDECVILTK